jgi:hypothetical protein
VIFLLSSAATAAAAAARDDSFISRGFPGDNRMNLLNPDPKESQF